MSCRIVLLRGVNVGGRKVSMAGLRNGLEAARCTGVVTYIQSGNVILTPPRSAPKDIRAWLEQVVSDLVGFDVPVVIRTLPELRRCVDRNPYPEATGTQLHVVFFASAPDKRALATLELSSFEPETFSLVANDLYLYLPDGIGRAKLPVALERAGRRAKLPAVGTARNWNTVLKLVELASAS